MQRTGSCLSPVISTGIASPAWWRETVDEKAIPCGALCAAAHCDSRRRLIAGATARMDGAWQLAEVDQARQSVWTANAPLRSPYQSARRARMFVAARA
jgi:hypothetical protein